MATTKRGGGRRAGKRTGASRERSASRAATPAGPATGTRRARKRAPAAIATRVPRASAARVADAARKYESGILARREAVPRGKPLPPGATHVITGKTRGGGPVLKRRRFSTH